MSPLRRVLFQRLVRGFMRYWHHWYFFNPFTVDHLAVLTGLAAAAGLVVRLGRRFDSAERRLPDSGPARFMFERSLVVSLVIAWLIGQLKQLQPGQFSLSTSLPLHICDVVGLIAPLALWLRWRWLRSVLHFWGFALSSLAFAAPVIRHGPASLEYWAYFISHGAIVVAAVYDTAVRGYRPRWSDFRLAAILSAAYAAIVFPIDIALDANYGYLGRAASGRSAQIAAWGAWPARVPRLLLSAWTAMAAMVVPWDLRRRIGRERTIRNPSPYALHTCSPGSCYNRAG